MLQQINHILTFLIVAWFLGIVSFATWIVLTAPMEIPTSAMTVLGTIYAIPALAVGLWKWSGDKVMELMVLDIVTNEERSLEKTADGKYILEYDPKKHHLLIKQR